MNKEDVMLFDTYEYVLNTSNSGRIAWLVGFSTSDFIKCICTLVPTVNVTTSADSRSSK